jgi:hypothetical protein
MCKQRFVHFTQSQCRYLLFSEVCPFHDMIKSLERGLYAWLNLNEAQKAIVLEYARTRCRELWEDTVLELQQTCQGCMRRNCYGRWYRTGRQPPSELPRDDGRAPGAGIESQVGHRYQLVRHENFAGAGHAIWVYTLPQ